MIEAVEGYLEMRRLLRYKDVDLTRDLRRFARQAEVEGYRFLDNGFVRRWISTTRGRFHKAVLAYNIRHLGQYLHAEDERHEIIPAFFGKPRQSGTKLPYIYEPEEIAAIMDRLAHAPLRNHWDARTYSTVVGLLAATGMRLGEALALDLEDLRTDHVLVTHGKFGKRRMVFIDHTTSAALRSYVRDRPSVVPGNAVFVTAARKRVRRMAMETKFRAATDALGYKDTHGTGLPRLHDLRHTFAVRSLAACEFDGKAVSAHVVALSVHLGHVSLKSTFWYLRSTFEMKERVAQAMELSDG